MVLERLIPVMFHRRLLLLLSIMAAGLGLLVLQLGNLTLAQGAEAKREAEARLRRQQWTPTIRGRILDRKGRILACDRPAYDLAMLYPVLEDDWARVAARRKVAEAMGRRWSDLPDDSRNVLVDRAERVLTGHMERAMQEIARAAGISRAELEDRRRDTIRLVEARHDWIMNQRKWTEITLAVQQKKPLTPSLMRSIESRAIKPIAEQEERHILAMRVEHSAAFELEARAAEDTRLLVDQSLDLSITVDRYPGLSVLESGGRDYPLESMDVELDLASFPGPLKKDEKRRVRVDGVAFHVLGTMRDRAFKEDNARRAARIAEDPAFRARVSTADGTDRGVYRDNDRVGSTGAEGGCEDELRGQRGLRMQRLDTGDVDYLPATPGRDVTLTIDAQLQARVQAVMTPEIGLATVQPWHGTQRIDPDTGKAIVGALADGTPLNGAAVVLEIETGEVLAMVSMPTITREQIRSNGGKWPDDPQLEPAVNRAINKAYQPGSIVKALLLAEANKRGDFGLGDRIACNGYLLPNQPDKLRCWWYKRFQQTHSGTFGHDLDGSEALMVSCNVFFFTIGRRLGPDGIRAAFEDFGLGQTWDLGIGPEFSGAIGAMGQVGASRGVSVDDAIQMGIGQGPVAWTPLHAAEAYAALQRGGVRLTPRVIKDRRTAPPEELGLNARAVAMAEDGLHRSVNDEQQGTGHHISFESREREPIFNAPGVEHWGKTGTADASPTVVDIDGPGPQKGRIVRNGDHSWFVVMVGPKGERPRYVVAVVMEYAGSGGKVSGPIANQIVRALIAEGYL